MSDYFFEEIKTYVGFDADVEQCLRECEPHVEPHYLEIVESFYDALWANPRTQAVFSGPEQVVRLRHMLLLWLQYAFSGPWDQAYFALRMRIGRTHVEVGLLPHFMFGAMNIIRRHIVRILDEAEVEVQHLEAIERLLDLELTIMLQSYWDHMMEMKLKMPLALASGLAHEIRNPLNAIALNLTLLERKMRAAGAEDGAPIIDAVRNEVRRISSLTSEMMDFARPVEVQPGWHRADALLASLDAMHGPTLDASQIEFSTSLHGDPLIFCDLDRIRQVLVNLLTNAAEAIESRGKIELAICNQDRGTLITMRDDGGGMEPGLKHRVFDLFFTQKAQGTGLGLAIVKNIVEAHGGTIEVMSRVGEGTTFEVRLPRPERPAGNRRSEDDG